MEDDFAQSRGADDLFMDEFESPPNEPAGTYIESTPLPQPSPKPAQLSAENVERHTQAHYDREYEAQKYGNQNQQQNNQNGGRGGRRGRGRGRGNQNQNGNVPRENNQRQQQVQQGAINSAAVNTPPPAPAPDAPPAVISPEDKPAQLERVDDTIASIAAPMGPAAQHRVQAVRGDRTATGPPKPKKRTEAEITELMAKMKLKSSAAAEAHERTKKDQAAFEQREREAAKERAEKVVRERQNVRMMDSERAKNAIRKQKAMQGREWDSEKQDSDIVDKSRGNSSRFMKGANGGIARDVPPRKEVSDRMEQAARAVRSVEDDFPALGAGLSGARGAAGRGGGITAKQGGRGDLFPNGPGQAAHRGGNSNRGAPRGGARGGGLGASRYTDVADDKKVESKRSTNTDIRLGERTIEQKAGEMKTDPEAGKKEFEELKKADEGNVTSWAEEANEAA